MKKEKHVVAQRSKAIVKFDYSLWKEMSQYLQEHYEGWIVEIETKAEDEILLEDMNQAFERICQDTENIESIKVTGKAEGEVYKLTLNNHSTPKERFCLSIYGECRDADRENNLRFHIIDMLNNHKALDGGNVVIDMIGIILIILCVNYLEYKISINSYSGFKFVILIALLTIRPYTSSILYGKNKIQFLTNYENIAKYNKMKKAEIIISIFLFIIAVALMLFVALY